ncbi:hypothetical protein H1C71_001657 [Ictidomys tridecemlineatus]|nr:hypothetical protein H1C71_001657 [Ictidomys tridecemlineatus]
MAAICTAAVVRVPVSQEGHQQNVVKLLAPGLTQLAGFRRSERGVHCRVWCLPPHTQELLSMVQGRSGIVISRMRHWRFGGQPVCQVCTHHPGQCLSSLNVL